MGSKRQVFSETQMAQYFQADRLEKMAGRPQNDFHRVVVKELQDNALDAAESAGVAPEVGVQVVLGRRSYFGVRISDNGPGISQEVLDKLLDFSQFASDKALYRTPSRGQQGNALKTVFAMPYATQRSTRPTVDSLGVRHEIDAGLDDAGLPKVGRESESLADSSDHSGTTVYVPLGLRTSVLGRADQDAQNLVRAYHVFNPHAKVTFEAYVVPTEQDESPSLLEAETHLPTNVGYRKFTAHDPLVIHWFDARSFLRLIRAHVREGQDLPIGQFIKLFRGFSARGKAAAAREIVSHARRISELSANDAKALLEVMHSEVKEPTHNVLGQPLGREHMVGALRTVYGSGDDKRAWYSNVIRTRLNGAPAIVGAAVVELDDEWAFVTPPFIGINHSPVYEDPLRDFVDHPSESVTARGYGIKGFLKNAKALEYEHPHAVAVHIIAAAPSTSDFSKTALSVDSHEFIHAVAAALSRVTKTITKEARARERDAARAEREAERRARGEKPTLTKAEACFEVLYEAYMFSTGNESLPTFARDLYYAVRNRIERFGYDADELTYDYFSAILPAYRREVQELPKVEYEPRGTLYEPHDGEEVQLGTRAVAEYSFPDYVYNRILYIEKNGRVQILQAAGLDKKYDMALVGGQGFATEAVRRLFESAEKGNYQLFVLHDADRSGYGIARTLREETKRMPGYSVDVVDIGLKLGDALEMGKRPETHTVKSRLDAKVEAELTETEREHFVGEEHVSYKDGKKKSSWVVKRVELNDLSSPQLVEYVEKKLEEHGATEKVIPTREDMPERAKKLFREKSDAWVDQIVVETIGTAALKDRVAEEFEPLFKLPGARTWAATEFAKRDVMKSWCEAVKDTLQAAYGMKHGEAIAKVVRAAIKETVDKE